VANAVSNNIMGIGAWDFLTAGTSLNKSTGISGWSQSGDPHSKMITLQEIMQGSQSGSGHTINSIVMDNVKANWLPLTVAVVGIPIVAKVATKLLRKSTILPANRMLKNTLGLDVKI